MSNSIKFFLRFICCTFLSAFSSEKVIANQFNFSERFLPLSCEKIKDTPEFISGVRFVSYLKSYGLFPRHDDDIESRLRDVIGSGDAPESSSYLSQSKSKAIQLSKDGLTFISELSNEFRKSQQESARNLANAIECTREALRTSDPIFQPNVFLNSVTKSTESKALECKLFWTTVLPSLAERLTIMRQYLAVHNFTIQGRDPNVPLAKIKLKHPPVMSKLGVQYLELEPLQPLEIEIITKKLKENKMSAPEVGYFLLVNQSPVLLFLSSAKLNLSELLAGFNFQQKRNNELEMKGNVDKHELFLFTRILNRILVGKNEKINNCVFIHGILSNFDGKNMAGLTSNVLFSIATTMYTWPYGIVRSLIFNLFTNEAISFNVSKTFAREFWIRSSICSIAFPTRNGVRNDMCHLEKLSDLLKDAPTSLIDMVFRD